MKLFLKITAVSLITAFILSACGSEAQPTPQPDPTQPVPPALATLTPTAVSSPPEESGYPAPIPTTAGYPAQPTQPPAPGYPAPEQAAVVPTFTYQVVQAYPHNAQSWTQGLEWHDGFLYEGTGRIGQSYLRKIDLESGEVLQEIKLDDEFYGEGITIFNGSIYQITWQNQTAFRYDLETFALQETYRYPTEGWGITHDDTRLIMSDGSNTLYFRDPETFAEIGRVSVFDESGQPVIRLNELEYLDGFVFANVWQTERIARIDPETGLVTGWVDLSGLTALAELDTAVTSDPSLNANAVLNGIAYDVESGRFLVTGKLWPKLFDLDLRPSS